MRVRVIVIVTVADVTPCILHLHNTVCVGDEIVDVTVIDDGWMEGRVKRTGKFGMLPSNYVEKR